MTTPAPQSGLLVLDTSVASEKFRGTSDNARYGHIFDNVTAALPLPAVAELLQLPYRNNWGRRRLHDLQAFISGFPILIPSRATADWWASIRADCARLGIAASENDAWIAATAVVTGGELVSYDGDYPRMSIAVARLHVIRLERPAPY